MIPGTRFRISLRCIAVVALSSVASACGNASAPPPTGLTGEYVLGRVGDATLPIRGTTYGDGSYDELVRASLRFLSRSRLKVAATTMIRNADNTLVAELVDSLVFEYVRKGDLLELTLRDTRGVHIDSIQILKFGSDDALRVTSGNFTQKGTRPALIPVGLYLRLTTPAAVSSAPALPFPSTGVPSALLRDG